jgi:hypothetical protein
MTLSAIRNLEDPNKITITYNYGPTTIHLTEDARHVRGFWSQLGVVLEEIEEGQDK